MSYYELEVTVVIYFVSGLGMSRKNNFSLRVNESYFASFEVNKRDINLNLFLYKSTQCNQSTLSKELVFIISNLLENPLEMSFLDNFFENCLKHSFIDFFLSDLV